MIIKIIILSILTLEYICTIILKVLNKKYSLKSIPNNVNDVYDINTYEKWMHYRKEKDKLSIIVTTVNYVFTFLLYITNAYVIFINILPENAFLGGIIFLVSYSLFDTLINIYFEYYDQMKIEEKFGFNKTTKKTFILDNIKTFIIQNILMIGILVIYILISYNYQNWIFLTILFLFIIGVVLLFFFLSPYTIKIYNKCTILEEGTLRTKLYNLLNGTGYNVKEIYVIDGSKRSTKANAFFVGIGKNRRIMLYDTLITQMSEDEIIAIFAHEVGHGVHKDIIKGLIQSILMIFIFMTLIYIVINYQNILLSLGINNFNYGFALLIFINIILTFISPMINLVTNYLSRKHEYNADKYAVEKGYGKELISGLKKLSRNSFSNLNPHPLVVKIMYSHPTLSERINNINKYID